MFLFTQSENLIWLGAEHTTDRGSSSFILNPGHKNQKSHFFLQNIMILLEIKIVNRHGWNYWMEIGSVVLTANSINSRGVIFLLPSGLYLIFRTVTNVIYSKSFCIKVQGETGSQSVEQAISWFRSFSTGKILTACIAQHAAGFSGKGEILFAK